MKRLLLRTAAFVGGAATLAVAIYVGLVAFGVFSVEYGFHPAANSHAWAARPVTYTSSAECARCHEPERTALSSARHTNIGCQSCHGPLEKHVLASKPDRTTVPVIVPDSDLCLRCHTTSEARPGSQPQITPANHYTNDCLGCHNPHSGVANRPPVVSHPLDRLPPCIICHGPDGLRARTARHPVEPTADNICLGCHAIGRGQIDVRETR